MTAGTQTHPISPYASATEALHRWSFALTALGGLIIGIGLWATAASVASTVLSVYTIGALMLVAGVAELVLTFMGRTWRGVASHVIVGILTAVVGVIFLRAPMMGASAFTLLFAAWLTMSGIGEIAHAMLYHPENSGISILSGTVSTVLGLALLAMWPVGSLTIPGVFAGISLIIHGVNWIMLSLAVRREMSRRLTPGSAT
jgi:uncharacterized membrane protein HdeD (DUF308 family)